MGGDLESLPAIGVDSKLRAMFRKDLHPRHGRFLMARNADTIRRDIDRLKTARASGVRSTTVDGQSTTFASDEEMRRVIGDLESELAVINGARTMAKPRFINVNLGGCM